jgi:hypothetical protein
MTTPKYLTGDHAAINEFIDQFDVGRLIPPPSPPRLNMPLTVRP